MSPTMTPAANQWRSIADQTIGRAQGPELWESLTHTFAAPTMLRPNRFLDCAIPIESLIVVLSGRVVIGTANYTTDGLEIPQNLVQRFRLRGRHKQYGAQTLLDIAGSTAFAWPRLFQQQGSWSFSGAALNALDAQLTIPMAASMAATIGTVDFEVYYYLPMYPMLGDSPASYRWAAPFFLREEDWGETLQLEIDMADNSGLGDPAATTTTVWTAYGVATGSPTVDIYAVHSMLGPFSRLPGTGFVVRSEDEVAPTLAAVTADVSLYQLRKQITTSVVVKSGVIISTGITGGVQTFLSVSDRQLDRTQVVANNKRVRNTGYNRATKLQQAIRWNTIVPEGYLVISFADGKSPMTALRGDKTTGIFELRTDVDSASADNRQHIIQEQIIGGPYPV